jgi:hypothetical protein
VNIQREMAEGLAELLHPEAFGEIATYRAGGPTAAPRDIYVMINRQVLQSGIDGRTMISRNFEITFLGDDARGICSPKPGDVVDLPLEQGHTTRVRFRVTMVMPNRGGGFRAEVTR